MMSPAQVIFGHDIRNQLPTLVDRLKPRPEWRKQMRHRELAMARRHGRTKELNAKDAHALPPLERGDVVVVQELQNKDGRIGKQSKLHSL